MRGRFRCALIILLMQGSGVENHPEDDDLTDEDDGHQVAAAVETHRDLGLKLKHGFFLFILTHSNI